jgi:hypothetical protein
MNTTSRLMATERVVGADRTWETAETVGSSGAVKMYNIHHESDEDALTVRQALEILECPQR